MPYRCREKECAKRFSVCTKTLMEPSKLGFQVWAIALYQVMANLKGVSSMTLYRDLGIRQRSARFLAHRLREAWKSWHTVCRPRRSRRDLYRRKEKNKHASKKLRCRSRWRWEVNCRGGQRPRDESGERRSGRGNRHGIAARIRRVPRGRGRENLHR